MVQQGAGRQVGQHTSPDLGSFHEAGFGSSILFIVRLLWWWLLILICFFVCRSSERACPGGRGRDCLVHLLLLLEAVVTGMNVSGLVLQLPILAG